MTLVKGTHPEDAGDVLAVGVDDIRGQDRADGELLVSGEEKENMVQCHLVHKKRRLHENVHFLIAFSQITFPADFMELGISWKLHRNSLKLH